MAGIDLAWALAARRAAAAALRATRPRALVYSTTTAALLWPEPGAIRFDAPAAGNRPGAARGLAAAGRAAPPGRRAAARAVQRGRPRRGSARRTPSGGGADPGRAAAGRRPRARRRRRDLRRQPAQEGPRPRAGRLARGAPAEGETLVVAGSAGRDEDGVRFAGLLPRAEYRALLRRARVFVTAPRREDYGMAQLEALADGCLLVTTPAPGPVRRAAAGPRARRAAGGRRPRRRPAHRARHPRARLRRARPRPRWRRSRRRRWTPGRRASCCRGCWAEARRARLARSIVDLRRAMAEQLDNARRASRSRGLGRRQATTSSRKSAVCDAAPSRVATRAGRARRAQTPAARSSAATTAATATATTIEPPRHRTSAGGGDAGRVGADGELVAVGEHLGHDERREQRRREQGHDRRRTSPAAPARRARTGRCP